MQWGHAHGGGALDGGGGGQNARMCVRGDGDNGGGVGLEGLPRGAVVVEKREGRIRIAVHGVRPRRHLCWHSHACIQ